MSSSNVIVYARPGADPAVERITTEHEGSRTILIAADPDAIESAAIQAVHDGAERVELCGALGPLWHAKVLQAVGDRASVGAVMFGFESLTGVADYKARYGSEFLREAFVYVQPGSDPAVDRTVTENEHSRTYFVAVPDVSAAPEVAEQLVGEEGVQLIELYGGVQPADAARVIEAIDARAPVGIPSYAAA
jgi:Family of unknown function (DUF6506)